MIDKPPFSAREFAGARRVIVALDVDDPAEARAAILELSGYVGGFKIGLQLIMAGGLSLLRADALGDRLGFLDAKFHDIPNTVEGATRAVAGLPISLLTIHASGGMEMMRAAMRGATAGAEAAHRQRPKLLGVTVLTSIDNHVLNSELQISGNVSDRVAGLVDLCMAAGIDGVVCSPHEVVSTRKRVGPDFLVVTPGIRPEWASLQDQKRVLTPAEAVRGGASYMVIGRPVLHPPTEIGDSVSALHRIAAEISSVL